MTSRKHDVKAHKVDQDADEKTKSPFLTVTQARNNIIDGLQHIIKYEAICCDTNLVNRVIASPVVSPIALPRHHLSAMDGYAVRRQDLAAGITTYFCKGESAAGHPYTNPLKRAETVRIFTGAILPPEADHVIIQENVSVTGTDISLMEASDHILSQSHVRLRGLDVQINQEVMTQGTRITVRHLALLHALGIEKLNVFQRPKIAIFATGDEIKPQGANLQQGEIYDSTSAPLKFQCTQWGGDVTTTDIITDHPEIITEHLLKQGQSVDLIVTIGGASVGDHDHVQQTLIDQGYHINFWKILMRPGKPLMFAQHSHLPPVVALPGNPVSAMVCAHLFIQPALGKLAGLTQPIIPHTHQGILGCDLPQNGIREDYMRATLRWNGEQMEVHPYPTQDSSMLHVFAHADALLVRPANDPPALTGEPVFYIDLN